MNMTPIRFSLSWPEAVPYTILVSIYAEDGTVAVSHGGVEIGQGINTKVCRKKEEEKERKGGRGERERELCGWGGKIDRDVSITVLFSAGGPGCSQDIGYSS